MMRDIMIRGSLLRCMRKMWYMSIWCTSRWMYMSRRRLHLLMRESIWRKNMMELRDLVSSHGILENLMICLSLHDTVIMFQLDYGLARWHSETSSFHMPFGEMTITLDDVANLLGLPIRGEFYSPPDVDRVTACNLAVHLLGVTTEEIWEETRKTRGAHYRLDWLKEVFRRQCAAERFDCAARAYLLNLVGSTIFADKSHTLVDAKYLPLFRYLDGIDRYAWGTAALVVLYDYLSDACYYDTKQLGGYMTLLQCWIYEYFRKTGTYRKSVLRLGE
uniref:Protein MAIN-LIKE 1-like n=1 Tax=Cicer arietinum TaxID=3827 RepID=A0A1S2YXN4_CICAR|nr:protein MAIN-LIKE 1-like [Cicer arietinum]